MTGTAHTAPGSELNLYALRQRSGFLALTNAVAYGTADHAWERAASVILVNLAVVVEFKEMVTIALVLRWRGGRDNARSKAGTRAAIEPAG